VKLPPVLFDLDGTLIDSRESVERYWRRWARRRGLDPEQVLPFVHGHRTIDTIEHFAQHVDCAAEARRMDAEQAADTAGLTPIAGAAEVLEALGPTRWGIVTSGSHGLATARLRAGGLPVPQVLVCAEDVEAGKPAPDGYLAGAAKLGAAPKDCVAVEDTPAGIAAAQAAQMLAVAVTTTHPAGELADANVVIGSLGDLLPVLDRLRSGGS
jgi:mannitol-1-/sugar-/sorbitol-6-phosphatase